MIKHIDHAALILQRDDGQLVVLPTTPNHDVRLNGADGAGYPDFSQMVVGGTGEKVRNRNAVVRRKGNSQRSHKRRSRKKVKSETRLRISERQRDSSEQTEREKPQPYDARVHRQLIPVHEFTSVMAQGLDFTLS